MLILLLLWIIDRQHFRQQQEAAILKSYKGCLLQEPILMLLPLQIKMGEQLFKQQQEAAIFKS